MWAVELRREESRRGLQDLIRPAQLAILPLKLDQPGLIAFKRKFASEEKDVCFLEWLPQNHGNAQGDQASQVLGRVTRLLTEASVPDEIASAAGSELYRFFA